MPEAIEPGAEAIAQELFERFYEPIRLFFVRRGFTSEQAEDLTQESLLRAFQRIDSLRDPSAARSWLFAVATNVYRNTLRNRQAGKRSVEEEPLESKGEAADAVMAVKPASLDRVVEEEKRRQLLAAIGKLPPRMRRVVLLRVGQDLTYQEIAVVLGVSMNTVRSVLAQAHRRLREALTP